MTVYRPPRPAGHAPGCACPPCLRYRSWLLQQGVARDTRVRAEREEARQRNAAQRAARLADRFGTDETLPPGTVVWRTAAGQDIAITDLTDDHLNSILRFIAQPGRDDLRRRWGSVMLAERRRRDQQSGVPSAEELQQVVTLAERERLRLRRERERVRARERRAAKKAEKAAAVAMFDTSGPVMGRRRNAPIEED